MKTTIKNREAFTLIELLVVIAIIAILAAILMPVLSAAKQSADQTYCLNNMRQWGIAFHMYNDDNNGYVPEEGNVNGAINDPGTFVPGVGVYTSTPNLTAAWYNVIPPGIGSPSLVTLYGGSGHAKIPPVPSSHSLFSCPSCAAPMTTAPFSYTDPPSVRQAVFMYGENARLCVNWSSRFTSSGPTGLSQTKLINVLKPSQTVFLGETDPNSLQGGTQPPLAASNVTAFWAVARHMKNSRGNLAMCDGSCICARTNDFSETQGMANGTPYNDGRVEWASYHTIYWYPSATTPN